MLSVAVWVNVIGVLVMLVTLFYVLIQNPSIIQKYVALLILATMLMIIGYVMEITATDMENALMAAKIGYLGKPFALIALYMFIKECCRIKQITVVNASLAIASALFSIIVFTNDYHHLYYSSVGFDGSKTFSPLILEHGVLYYVYMAYMLSVFLCGIVCIIIELRKRRARNSKKQVLALFAIILSNLIGYILFLTIDLDGYDTTMIGSVLSIVWILLLFFKYNLFDYMLYAKNKALDEASIGVLVLNEIGTVVYENKTIEKLIANGTIKLEELVNATTGESNLIKSDKVYRISKSDVINDGVDFGDVIEVSDITTQYYYVSQLAREVDEKTKELRDVQKGIIASFAELVEARDGLTGQHVKRVSKYVELIAKSMLENGDYSDVINEQFISKLVETAPLHDVGKITISDTILLKPGKLTTEEFNVIKTHTGNGAKIIDNCFKGLESEDYIAFARDVALYHHEKWDGSGYPNNLKGQEIPLSARIVSVADVFDALCSNRCYKQALPIEDSLQIVLENKEKQFDPIVVEALVRIIPQIKNLDNLA